MSYPRAGRNLKVYRDTSPRVLLAGIMTKQIQIGNEVIDITNDDDLGYQSFLSEVGNRAVNLSVDGVSKDEILLAAALNGSDITIDLVIEFPSGSTVSGNFVIASLSYNGDTKDAFKFSATLNSNGAYTFTQASPST